MGIGADRHRGAEAGNKAPQRRAIEIPKRHPTRGAGGDACRRSHRHGSRHSPGRAGSWRAEWPRTDFSQHAVPLEEIRSSGPRKDGIPSIDGPRFERLNDGVAAGWASRIGDAEPVISLSIRGDARAYPLSILIWHEIVNDSVGSCLPDLSAGPDARPDDAQWPNGSCTRMLDRRKRQNAPLSEWHSQTLSMA